MFELQIQARILAYCQVLCIDYIVINQPQEMPEILSRLIPLFNKGLIVVAISSCSWTPMCLLTQRSHINLLINNKLSNLLDKTKLNMWLAAPGQLNFCSWLAERQNNVMRIPSSKSINADFLIQIRHFVYMRLSEARSRPNPLLQLWKCRKSNPRPPG